MSSVKNSQRKPALVLASINSANNENILWAEEIKGTLGIVKIEKVHRADKVYNIEVENDHTYFVTKGEMLVHNYPGQNLVRGVASLFPKGNIIEKLDKNLTVSEFKESVVFGEGANPEHIPDDAMYELSRVAEKSGVKNLIISSTRRDAKDQARVMYNNLESEGVDAQRELYKKADDQVIDVYVAGKKSGESKSEIKSAMEKKISALGPSKVSNHAADPNKVTTFDVAPSSIPADKRKSFIKAAKANPNIQKVIPPPKDPGIHFEIPRH
ncbi:MAG: hypothetical protein L6Q54_13540, partial [Leptospiraceae bacterium]|nr:hypothetical protein [Leptospiraceae bacterium]